MSVTCWAELHALPRHAPGAFLKRDVPKLPGVYAWYRNGSAIYVGIATSLQSRIWTHHLGGSRSLHTSAFRRNVAEVLGFGDAADIFAGLIRLDERQLRAVRDWIWGCQVAWYECHSPAAAKVLEDQLKDEMLPRLTKR